MFGKKSKTKSNAGSVSEEGMDEKVGPVPELEISEEKPLKGITFNKPPKYNSRGKNNPNYTAGSGREYTPNTRTIAKKPEQNAEKKTLSKKSESGIIPKDANISKTENTVTPKTQESVPLQIIKEKDILSTEGNVEI